MLVTGRDRWLFDHMSWCRRGAFSVLGSGSSPREVLNLVRIEISAYPIYEPMYTVTLLLQIMYHFFVSSLCNIFMYQMYQMCNTFMSHFPRGRVHSLGAAGVDVKKVVNTSPQSTIISIWKETTGKNENGNRTQ